jgi:hypothetical protein
MNDAAIEFVDLAPHLRRIDPAYLEPAHAGPAAEARIHALAWTAADARLYVVVANAFVFWSDNGGRYWHEVPEVNRRAGALALHGEQHIDAIVDTPRGTVLLLGRDRYDGPERGVVWRRPAGAGTFTRTVATDPPWGTTKGGNATAGWFGTPPREMVALSVYVSPAHFWFSLDDGVTWRRQELGDVFAHHVHEVLLHRSATLGRASRLWVTGGDDPSGTGSGVTTFESLDADGTLAGFRYVLRERPGYRLVGLAGDGKHVYVGNESLSGGVLRVLDNAQSIELADFEYALGKARHDYHQFRSLVATPDGLLAAASDSYAFVSDTIRADSGGYLYLSNDGGASCRELSLGMKWITGLVYDGSSFWVAGGMNREYGPDPTALRLTLLRVPKPAPFTDLSSAYCAKPVVMDSSAFYEMAGYADHPHPALAPGERTFRVDMAPYASISVVADTRGPAELVVEALSFRNWHPDHDRWHEVATLRTDGPGRAEALLPRLAAQNRWYRVRNAGAEPVELRELSFIGRR